MTVAAKKEKPVISSTLYASILVSLRLYFENAYNSNKVDTALTSGSSASMRPMELFSGEELTERPTKHHQINLHLKMELSLKQVDLGQPA